jgi:hypothetical protein
MSEAAQAEVRELFYYPFGCRALVDAHEKVSHVLATLSPCLPRRSTDRCTVTLAVRPGQWLAQL